MGGRSRGQVEVSLGNGRVEGTMSVMSRQGCMGFRDGSRWRLDGRASAGLFRLNYIPLSLTTCSHSCSQSTSSSTCAMLRKERHVKHFGSWRIYFVAGSSHAKPRKTIQHFRLSDVVKGYLTSSRRAGACRLLVRRSW